MFRCLSSKSDFRTIHSKHARVTAWCAVGSRNGAARQETEFHQTASYVVGHIKALENCLFAGMEFRKSGCLDWVRPSGLTPREFEIQLHL